MTSRILKILAPLFGLADLRPPRRSVPAALFGCALFLASCSTLPPVPPPDAEAAALDFGLIYHLAQVYASVRFDSVPQVRADCS